MAAYHWVYDSRHLQADCQEPGSSLEPYARQSSMGYLYLYLNSFVIVIFKHACQHCEMFLIRLLIFCIYHVSPKNVHLFIFWITLKNWPILITFGTLNPKKIWHNTLQICPSHLSDVSTLPWEIQKSHFSTLLFIYFRLFTFAQKTRSSAIAEGPCDALCQLKSCQLPRNSAETTCTTSPEQIEIMKLKG